MPLLSQDLTQNSLAGSFRSFVAGFISIDDTGGRQEGVEVIDVDAGAMKFTVVPTRGLNVWTANVGDLRLGWDSPAVGVSFITYNESSERLLETAKIQAENLKVLQRQAAADLLTAKVHSLTSRLQGYEEQIEKVRAMNSNSMTPERRTEENPDVSRMRNKQDKLYRQLDRILDDLKIGTKVEVPPEGTYSNPFGSD